MTKAIFIVFCSFFAAFEIFLILIYSKLYDIENLLEEIKKGMLKEDK